MKASIKKLLAVGVKLRVVSFQRKVSKCFSISDKADVLASVQENSEKIKNFRITSENIDENIFDCSFDTFEVPEKLDCVRAIDKVQSNAIRFDT